ncbi:MAG: sulfatase-like hydrolase/transferase [Verrucomicrobiales bacterium]|nr:sulfatase-like hydrolase/transferase [Verrucomicrobiales bacterium]
MKHVLALFCLFASGSVLSADKPNILWISAEDINAHFGCYGDPHAITPNLDRLAKEGVRYTNCYTAAGVCAPNRSTIITGMYQNSIGTHHMRCNAKLPEWLKPFPMYLKDAGYYCTNNSKTDYQFSKPGKSEIWRVCSSKGHWKNREDGQPFFAVYNFTGCHESGIAGKSKYETVTKNLTPEQRQDAAKLTTLPPYYPDTPITREDWKRNYELITAMDAWAGDLIQQLKDAGEYENTIIMYWSDHGVGLPRAKRWLYDSGTRVPLIVRIPEKFRVEGQGEPDTVDDQLVNSVDFGPAVLNLAGLELPDYFQGRAFLGKNLSEPRNYVFGARDRMDERYDIIRAVRDKRFRYIRNFEPLKPYYQYMNTPEKGATMQEIRRIEAGGGDMSAAMAAFSTDRKPVEELYDLENDPHEIHNLADDPAHAEKLTELKKALTDWQFSIGDIGLMPESEIEVREPEAGSAFAILNGNKDLLNDLTVIATKASEGKSAFPDLKAALDHDDAAIRYWGATGLGNFSDDAKSDADAVSALEKRLGDESPAVRIASARALCRMGKTDPALELLGDELSGEHQWARLQAAIALDYLEEAAKPVLPQLQGALKKQPNKYIIRVANRAVNDLLGTENRVP